MGVLEDLVCERSAEEYRCLGAEPRAAVSCLKAWRQRSVEGGSLDGQDVLLRAVKDAVL